MSNAKTHGDSRSRLYSIWRNIKTRCYNPNTHNYENYGGKGITLNKGWFDYNKFKEWAYSNGYEDNLTIDRVNNDKGYYPENCRWVDLKEQSRNRNISRYVTIRGHTKHAMEWCELYGMDYQTYIQRVTKLGWGDKEALETPKNNYRYKDEDKKYELFKGDTTLMIGTIKEISEEYGIPRYTVTTYGEPKYLERYKESNTRRKLREHKS